MQQIVRIEKLVFGGYGLARTDHGVLFVSDVLPDETICVDMNRELDKKKIAAPVRIETPSRHRRRPPCAYFGQCGGCDWLFGDYDVQLSSKKEIFLECLTRIGKISPPSQFDIFPSPEFGYRRRVQFKVHQENGALGFYRRKSRDVVSIRHCPLLDPALNTLLADAADVLRLLPPDATEIKCITGRRGAIASSPVCPNKTTGSVDIYVGNHSFRVSGDGFFQGNSFLSEKLAGWGKGIVGGKFVVDVYGGVGFFSIALNRCFSEGLIIDDVESHIVLARRNLLDNGISHITARTSTAERFLYESSRRGPSIDCLILDPPRPGLTKQVRDAVASCKPSTILYVSCNPSTQARDVGFFVRSAGYAIDAMALFDLYPNTHHMETIVALRK
jgi:23S rRNA (uracil1939-C5)-methyltransferase